MADRAAEERLRPRVAIALAACGLACAAARAQTGGEPSAAQKQATTQERLDDTRATLEKWVEVRRVISKEKRDWKEGREALQSRIDVVGREIASLREKIAEAERGIGEREQQKIELAAEKEKLDAAAQNLRRTVIALETRTKQLLQRLPDAVLERPGVETLRVQLPDDPEASEVSLGQRFMYVIGLLNDINKFNREVTLSSEVRKLGDGTTAEVTALYVGVGQAWYVTAKGDAAGVGRATPEGWVWKRIDEAAPAVAQAIAMQKNEKVAEFVRLPIELEQVGKREEGR